MLLLLAFGPAAAIASGNNGVFDAGLRCDEVPTSAAARDYWLHFKVPPG